MAERIGRNGERRGSVWRIAAWGLAGLILLLPLVAMQFTDEVEWTASDFILMGVLIGTVGLSFEFLIRQSSRPTYRIGAAIAHLAFFLTIWVNLAVGMIGSEGNLYNLLFGGVLVLALSGAVVAAFKPVGLARAMVIAAIAQAGAGAFGLSTDLRGGVLSMAFAALWFLAAALFWSAARECSVQSRSGAPPGK